MKLVGMLVAVAALLGMFINAVGGMFSGGDDPIDYPACTVIVRELGTSPNAKCVTGDEVIEAHEYIAWDTYHPAQ